MDAHNIRAPPQLVLDEPNCKSVTSIPQSILIWPHYFTSWRKKASSWELECMGSILEYNLLDLGTVAPSGTVSSSSWSLSWNRPKIRLYYTIQHTIRSTYDIALTIQSSPFSVFIKPLQINFSRDIDNAFSSFSRSSSRALLSWVSTGSAWAVNSLCGCTTFSSST